MPEGGQLGVGLVVSGDEQQHNQHKADVEDVDSQQGKPEQHSEHQHEGAAEPDRPQHPGDIDHQFEVLVDNQDQAASQQHLQSGRGGPALLLEHDGKHRHQHDVECPHGGTPALQPDQVEVYGHLQPHGGEQGEGDQQEQVGDLTLALVGASLGLLGQGGFGGGDVGEGIVEAFLVGLGLGCIGLIFYEIGA